MNDDLKTTLAHLEALIAFDTRNPPRNIGKGGIFDYLRAELHGFEFQLWDHGQGCVTLLAQRGDPDTVFNFHLDTVPATDGWRDDPLRIRVTRLRAYGLGSCDIKGAAACMLTAARQTRGDLALLFTSDEEAGQSRCIKRFLASECEFKAAVVAEPTSARAVLAHRGIATASATFKGVAGHASSSRALEDSALHRAVRWADHALEFATQREAKRYRNLSGIRFNLGTLGGGVKPNVIAPEATARFGIRPLPGQDGRQMLKQLRDLAPASHIADWQIGFVAPALPAGKDRRLTQRIGQLARKLGLPTGDAVNFWTEAALFAASGVPALVYGPGDIEQAHAANEWVALRQLQEVTASYFRLINHDH